MKKKKIKVINNNVVDDELKYEDFRTFLFYRSYIKQEMNRRQSKDNTIGTYRFNESFLSC